MPIGTVNFDRPTKAGITFTASIPKIQEPGLLKDRVDMAWGEVKHGLIRAVSVGFRPTKDPKPNEIGGLDWPGVEIFELSTVAVPAQELATIDQVKAIDAAVLRGEAPSTAASRGLWQEMQQRGIGALNKRLNDWTALSPDQRKAEGISLDASLVQAGVVEMLKVLTARVEATERRFEEQGRAYKGIWKPGHYSAGSFVTHGGSMWHADTATSFKPGEGGGWTLAVKKGADAK
jgi:hypothetical protein